MSPAMEKEVRDLLRHFSSSINCVGLTAGHLRTRSSIKIMGFEDKMILNGEPEDEEEEEEEEDMVDPLDATRQKCEETHHCVHYKERLEECETRVGSRSATTEDCTEELFDFLHARDHCVSAKLFHSVK